MGKLWKINIEIVDLATKMIIVLGYVRLPQGILCDKELADINTSDRLNMLKAVTCKCPGYFATCFEFVNELRYRICRM